MRAHEFVDLRGCRLVLHDLVDGCQVEELNIGAMADAGDDALIAVDWCRSPRSQAGCGRRGLPAHRGRVGHAGAFEAAAIECTTTDTAEAWKVLAAVVPDQIAGRCRNLALRADSAAGASRIARREPPGAGGPARRPDPVRSPAGRAQPAAKLIA